MAIKKLSTYLNNPNLKAAGVQIEFTDDNIVEYAKCVKSPVYFIENYCKVVSLDKGIVSMKLYGYQKKIINAIHKNRNVCVKLFRQAGKSTVVAAYIAWFCTFATKPEYVAILGNKAATAREIFSRVQFIIEELPKWLQQGVKEWNKTSFELENKVKCFAAASSPSSIRGKSISFLMLDEYGFLSPTLAEEFIASVFPTISSAKGSKMVIVSTPKGQNHFWKLWVEAEQGLNGFVPIQGHWSEHPDRDNEWAQQMRVQLGEVRYFQEIEAEFLGSSATLFNAQSLQKLPILKPITETKTLKVYEHPQKDRSYVSCVDVARGGGGDYSVITVFDITEMPYKIVAVFRDNMVNTLVFPEMVMKLSTTFNNAFCLIETNDLGQQVADILYYDLEYENVYMSSRDNIAEGGKSYSPGIRTTKKTKAVGCDTLKGLVENDQLTINDIDAIYEASNFVRVGTSYKAEEGKTDDIMMTLVIFAYLTTMPVFQDLFDYDLRKRVFANQLAELEDSFLPVGFSSDDYYDEIMIETHSGLIWTPV